ncbi:MAG: ABC-2 family transporter protein [Kineosporiaceae bacterium]|nr:ABC-2 family transporter protein [Kineosporiaceae bacterium]
MRGLLAVLRTALADALARRGAFWAQIVMMVLNDLVLIAFWLIFFSRVDTVRGWDGQRVLVLFAVLATGAGLVLGLLSNCRRIPEAIVRGRLDETLTLPVRPLPHLLVSRVDTINLGDVVVGVSLFALVAHPTPSRVALFVIGTLLGAVVFASFLIIAGSLAFFVNRDEPAGLALHAVLLFSSYPVDIFTGPAKLLLYTVVPAAFVAAVPARLVEQPSAAGAGLILAVAAGFAVAAWAVFTLGLRRYSSGSVWTRAA